MTNFAEQALEHLKAVTYDADRAQVFALLDIADAIRESGTPLAAEETEERPRGYLAYDA